ncbi:hypothetical protein M8494_30740 [Serratia ureilytica]
MRQAAQYDQPGASGLAWVRVGFLVMARLFPRFSGVSFAPGCKKCLPSFEQKVNSGAAV